jgi:hypothetical protein
MSFCVGGISNEHHFIHLFELTSSRQIFPSYTLAQYAPADNTALVRIKKKRAVLKALQDENGAVRHS